MTDEEKDVADTPFIVTLKCILMIVLFIFAVIFLAADNPAHDPVETSGFTIEDYDMANTIADNLELKMSRLERAQRACQDDPYYESCVRYIMSNRFE